MQPISRTNPGTSSFSSREASSLTNVWGLKRTHDLFLSPDAGSRVVACGDHAYKVSLEAIHDEVKCPICLGILNNTRTFMECMHRFCAECIEKYIRVRKKECPQCRMHCSSKRSLRPDKRFDSLVDALYPDRETIELQENIMFANPDMLCDARARLDKFTKEVQIQAKVLATGRKLRMTTKKEIRHKSKSSGSQKRKEKLALKLQAKELKKEKLREEKLAKKRLRRQHSSMPAPDIQSEQLEEAAPPRKRIKIRISSASKAVVEEQQASVGVETPPTIHEDDLRQVELMLHSFEGSPALDKVAYVCPGNMRVRALRRFIKASLAQNGHIVSKVSIAVELAGILPGDITMAAVRDVVCAGHAFFAVVLHYTVA